ncbi:MAG: signal peptidase II, partial [Nitrospira sp.]
MSKPTARYVLLGLVSVITVLLDQATKLQITQSMRLHESIPVVPDFFSITYIRNPGAAFGILASSSSGFRLAFFGVTSILALVLLSTIFVRLKPTHWIGQLSVAAIFGGAIGNLLDRVRFGEVIDFLDIYLGAYHWPAFNVADAAISAGVCFL